MHKPLLLLLAATLTAAPVLTALALTTSHAQTADPAPAEDPYPRPDAGDQNAATSETAGPERYIVRFDPMPRNLSRGDAYAGGTVALVDPALGLAAIETDAPDRFTASASTDANVTSMQPDPRVRFVGFTPDDPRFTDQYGPQQVGAPTAWETTLGTTDATLCVLDTGLRYTHEAFAGERWLGGIDLHNGDADPWDGFGHGTHVTGIAAAALDDGRGIAGMANAGVHAVKVLSDTGTGYSSTVASGIRWCADNAGPRTVISMSLSSGSPSSALADAVDYAQGRGALMVAAAGNTGPCTDCVRYPAAYPGVVAVTCTTIEYTRCSFSSQGATAEIAAPGASILSTFHRSDTDHRVLSGTSMSTPHVAGAAALLWSQHSNLAASEVRELLTSTAQDLGPAGTDASFGHGLLDVGAAMQAAGSPTDPPELEPVLEETFDEGTPGVLSTTGLWHASGACIQAASPPAHLAFREDADCDYDTGAPESGSAAFGVDLRGASTAELSFAHRWETESYASGAYDRMRVEVSTDAGATWTTLASWDSRDPNQATWTRDAISLDPWTDQRLRIRFSFDTVDDIANRYTGWAIDDVLVQADTPTPAPTNQPPTADAGPDRVSRDTDGSGGDFVQLDATASTDPDGQITRYRWTREGALVATGATPTLGLSTGVHQLTLTVTDDVGATDSDRVNVTVYPNQPPTASFDATVEGATVTTDGTPSTDPDGHIREWSWDWGDGSAPSTGPTAEHTYTASGTYTIRLTVEDEGSATDEATRTATVDVPTDPGTLYAADVEHGLPGWSFSPDIENLWRTGGGCLGSASGTQSLQFNQPADCDYATGERVRGTATSPAIDADDHPSVELAFRHAWETESWYQPYDEMLVQVRPDATSPWETVRRWDARDANQQTFELETIDVSAHAGDAFQVRFTFDAGDAIANGYAGWAIDDVEITTG